MPDSTRSSDPALTVLSSEFDIVGSLGGHEGNLFLIATPKVAADAKRRDGSGRALIEIVHTPAGDESHALDHLASDTKLLSDLRHRRLVPILEGRWISNDAFAVVREYVDDPTVSDILARGQPFTNTRTAAILREVHGLLQWAREQSVVHRHVTTDRVFLEPTSDRVRVTFGAGPLQRVRTIDATTEDVVTVVRLAVAMLSGAAGRDEADERTFAELRPDLPDRLHEETARLLAEPASDAELTLYLALIGMADPVAEGETERDRIRAEVLEEQRVEREKLANERAELARHVEEERRRLAEEGDELRGAFAQEKAKLEREFAEAQRRLAEERTEMQRIVAEQRAELVAKRDALEREMSVRVAEIERAAAADRASIDALRAKIREAAEIELEKKRAAALEDLDDSEIRLDTGRYATPRFVAPKLDAFPGIAFRRDDRLNKIEPVDTPTVPSEPWSVLEVARKLREPRKAPIPWGRWAATAAIAAAILITAGYAILTESRSPGAGFADQRGASARMVPAPPRPAATGAGATASTGGALGALLPAGAGTDSTTGAVTSGAAATNASPADAASPNTASPNGIAGSTSTIQNGALGTPMMRDTAAARARRDSVRRAAAARAAALARADTGDRGSNDSVTVRRAPASRGGDIQDLMNLRDSLAAGTDSAPRPRRARAAPQRAPATTP